MAYPPNPGAPTPTPTPRPVAPANTVYTSPADYLETCYNLLAAEDQDTTVKVGDVTTEMYRIYQVLRNAEE